MKKIFKNDMQPVSLWERIKLLFVKAQEDFYKSGREINKHVKNKR